MVLTGATCWTNTGEQKWHSGGGGGCVRRRRRRARPRRRCEGDSTRSACSGAAVAVVDRHGARHRAWPAFSGAAAGVGGARGSGGSCTAAAVRGGGAPWSCQVSGALETRGQCSHCSLGGSLQTLRVRSVLATAPTPWTLTVGATERFLEAPHQYINYTGVLRLKKKERSRIRYPQKVVLTELAQLQRVVPTCRPGSRHLCSRASCTPQEAMSDSADHP